MTWLIPIAVPGFRLLRYFGGNDRVHALSEEDGLRSGIRDLAEKWAKHAGARSRDQQRRRGNWRNRA
jgi:hypothetical protein